MDNYVQYGTPLEGLDETNIHLSKAPKLSDQIVKDKQGKRRFHGAFTGGFSAGYFNSVGTKEGWTPSSFVSSRSKRADQNINRNPVAFMDEDDISDFGIASQRIQTSSRFEDPAEYSHKRKRSDDSGPIPGQPVLHDLLKPVNITMGMKFLIKLGWRPGQGIGPRLSKQDKRKARKMKKNNSNNNNNTQNSTDSENDSDIDSILSHDFAPDDAEDSLSFNVKSNVFGLGYKPLERTNVLGHSLSSEFGSSFRMTEKNKKLSIRGQAFGVGAFEEEDEDIYTKEDMSDYDFDLGPSKSNSDKKKLQSRWDNRISLMGETLEGFHLSSKPFDKPKKIPLPSLPPDYKPWHESRKSRFSESAVFGKERLTSDERRLMVGNEPSIDIRSGIKLEEEERFKDKAPDHTFLVSDSLEAPEIAASSQYKPFAFNSEKQKRYELYTSSTCMDKDSIFPLHMTEWEKEREKSEFNRARAFNRPLTFSMSSRFTSAVHKDSITHLQEGLNEMKGNYPISSEDKVLYFESELADDMKAAKQKIFGKLTQTSVDWVPDKLLCRRFNVPNPFSSSAVVGVQSKQKERISLFDIIPEVPQNSFPQTINNDKETIKSVGDVKSPEESSNEKEDYGLKVPISNPPTIDLYNAIFQDSSDSEAEEEKSSQAELSTVNQQKSNNSEDNTGESISLKGLNEMKINKRSNENDGKDTFKGPNLLFLSALNSDQKKLEKIPFSNFRNKDDFKKSQEIENVSQSIKAKGIFKGIDFSALNQYRNLGNEESSQKSQITSDKDDKKPGRNRHDSNSSSSSNSTEGKSVKAIESHSESEEEYGPALPPHMVRSESVSESKAFSKSANNKNIFEAPVSTSLLEVEKKLIKAKKQKKKHKHKHKKYKKETKRRK